MSDYLTLKSSKTTTNTLVHWLRHASPYVNALRHSTVVIHFPASAIRDADARNLVHDIALLSHLDLRIVIIFGARAQIDQAHEKKQLASCFEQGQRITDDASLALVIETVGSLRLELEALLTMGVSDTPLSGSRLTVASGNFITAQPIGVIDGVDFAHTGKVRKVDHKAINHLLENGQLVLLSPLGYSRTGEIFNLRSEEVATETAIALKADKLIFLLEENLPHSPEDKLQRQMNAAQAEAHINNNEKLPVTQPLKQALTLAIHALRHGVPRAHLLDRRDDGALLTELYTRDGCGTLLFNDDYDNLRQAKADDVPGLLNLISPLEQQGSLIPRHREQLELDIDRFFLVERDHMVIACAALFPHSSGLAELACMATHQDYRGSGCAGRLLNHIELHAKKQGLNRLFVLTTQTAHWFKERGFKEATIEALPEEKQALYNQQRNSKVFIRSL